MKLCCPISPLTINDAIPLLKQAGKQSDLVEVRVDSIKDLNLSVLLKKPRPPVIITNRSDEEGGKFTGTVKERISILTEAMKLGAEYIDVEFSIGKHALGQLSGIKSKTKIIVSYHNFEATPGNLLQKYKQMSQTGDIIKIASMANDITDNRAMLDLLQYSKNKKPTIALCMGEKGQISRILQGVWGGYLTYSPLDKENSTAPGQLSIKDLIKIFRVPILDRKTKIFGLIGNPVSHSRGKYFHNNAFNRKKVNAVYVNFLTDSVDSFFAVFQDYFNGYSVTMPFKQDVIPFIDSIEPLAAQLCAVNTIVKQREKFFGCNTDLTAVVKILKKRTSLSNKYVTILGTGATAKIMAFAAVTQGAKTTIVGRNKEKAKALATQFGCTSASPDMIHDIQTDILMNGTSIGMGNDKNLPFISEKFLKPSMIVFDAVYSPPDTPLLLAAARAGCTSISGLELFTTQAKLQSKMFINSIL